MQPAPAMDLLTRVRLLWAEVLQLAPADVGSDSHFLLLGGDSLQLLRLLGRLRDATGVSLPVHELQRFATPRRMAACCLEDGSAVPSEAAQAAARPDRVPATAVQQGLWLAEQLAAPTLLYLGSVLLHLAGPLQFAALQDAWAALFRRYPVLGARLLYAPQTRSLELCLAQGDTRPAGLTLVDCGTASWPQCLQEALQAPLALERGPLCRLSLFRLAEQQHVLLLSCHHVVSDGWSGGLLLQTLAAAYARALQGRPALGAEDGPDHGFAGYCLRQAAAPASGMDVALQWWRSHLQGSESSQEWIWQGAGAEPWPHRVAMRSFVLPGGLVTRLQRQARSLRHSLFILFLDAVCAGLHALGGAARQALLVPLAQRQPDEEASVGCFVETLLLVLDWQPEREPLAALQAAAASFDASRRALLPLASLAARLRPRPLPDGNPWSSILFAYQSFPQEPAAWPGLEQRIEAVPASASQHALKLEILPARGADAAASRQQAGEPAGDWTLRIEYAVDLFAAARIECLASRLRARLQGLATLPEPGTGNTPP